MPQYDPYDEPPPPYCDEPPPSIGLSIPPEVDEPEHSGLEEDLEAHRDRGDHCFMVGVWFTCLCCVFGCWPSLLCSVMAIYFASAAGKAETELNIQEVKKNERLAIGLNLTAALSAVLTLATVVASLIIYRYFGHR